MTNAPHIINTILIAEDDAEDRLLVKRALEKCDLPQKLCFVENGEELLQYLHQQGAYASETARGLPDLILLDLKMPRKDGREALREIRSDPRLRAIPVVILTTSSAEMDVGALYALGANSYIIKPARFNDWIDMVETLHQYWFGLVNLPTYIENEA